MKTGNRKRIVIMILAVAIVASIVGISIIASGGVSIDTSSSDEGVVLVNYNKSFTTKVKAIVKKGDIQYVYDITSATTALPLQMGNGEYTISVHENVSGASYNTVSTSTVTETNLSDQDVYTCSIQMVDYENNMGVLSGVNSLLANASSDAEKVQIAYEYMTTNFSYDTEKAASVQSGYIPNLSEFISAGKGICYDYSSLFAAILRSNEIPTKLVMGYSNTANSYHAWNQVLLDGQWITIDTTYDAQVLKGGGTPSMTKDSANFQVSKVY